jgi:hypothetical protein
MKTDILKTYVTPHSLGTLSSKVAVRTTTTFPTESSSYKKVAKVHKIRNRIVLRLAHNDLKIDTITTSAKSTSVDGMGGIEYDAVTLVASVLMHLGEKKVGLGGAIVEVVAHDDILSHMLGEAAHHVSMVRGGEIVADTVTSSNHSLELIVVPSVAARDHSEWSIVISHLVQVHNSLDHIPFRIHMERLRQHVSIDV